jgi:hypothetical protein
MRLQDLEMTCAIAAVPSRVSLGLGQLIEPYVQPAHAVVFPKGRFIKIVLSSDESGISHGGGTLGSFYSDMCYKGLM